MACINIPLAVFGKRRAEEKGNNPSPSCSLAYLPDRSSGVFNSRTSPPLIPLGPLPPPFLRPRPLPGLGQLFPRPTEHLPLRRLVPAPRSTGPVPSRLGISFHSSLILNHIQLSNNIFPEGKKHFAQFGINSWDLGFGNRFSNNVAERYFAGQGQGVIYCPVFYLPADRGI